ncbi:MAG: hypothetical protein WA755_07290 [Candidatus Acidiferrales bacterium]
MGLFDWMGSACACPLCRQKGAKRFGNKVKCASIGCANYDRDYAEKSPQTLGAPAEPLARLSGNFSPANTIEIRYRNFRGDDQTYVGDASTIREVNQHVSVCLVPTGKRVAFAKKWLANLSDLQPRDSGPTPTGRERQVLSYHKKRGSTSPLYESLRQKYPNF